MDFLDKTIDYIELNIPRASKVKVGKLSTEPSGVAIRQTPSTVTSRYVNSGAIREFAFQILVKDTDQLQAIKLLNEITSILDGLKNEDIVSSDNSFKFINCKVSTLPNYVEETDKKEFIYTALFIAELEGGI